MNYRTAYSQLGLGGLQKPQGQAFFRALGIVKDYAAGLTRQAVELRFPDATKSSVDGIAACGKERLIDKGDDPTTGVTETISAYATRVRGAFGTQNVRGQAPTEGLWDWGGTANGMMQALGIQGYSPQLWQQNGITWSLSGGSSG